MSLFDFVKQIPYKVKGVEMLLPDGERKSQVNLLLDNKKAKIDLSVLTQTQKDSLRTIFTKLLKLGISQKVDDQFSSTEQDISDEIDALEPVEEEPEV